MHHRKLILVCTCESERLYNKKDGKKIAKEKGRNCLHIVFTLSHKCTNNESRLLMCIKKAANQNAIETLFVYMNSSPNKRK